MTMCGIVLQALSGRLVSALKVIGGFVFIGGVNDQGVRRHVKPRKKLCAVEGVVGPSVPH